MSKKEVCWDREQLGQLVRMAWIKWAKTQVNPKVSWLVPWKELDERDKEADRQIGEFIAKSCVNPELLKIETKLNELKNFIKELGRLASVNSSGFALECSQLIENYLDKEKKNN